MVWLRRFFRSLFEASFLFFAGALYLSALVSEARDSIGFEALVVVGIPIAFWWLGYLTYLNPRRVQLILIESFFLVIAVFSKLSIRHDWPAANHLLGFFVALFFILQTTGFLRSQVRLANYAGVLSSSIMTVWLALWFVERDATATLVDADGRLLFWGGDAPYYLKWCYVMWFAGVIIGDYNDAGQVRRAVLHSVSVLIAFHSGEFFHARLLTASHLIMLDAVFGYTEPQTLLPGFAEPKFVGANWYQKWIQPRAAPIAAFLCCAIFGAALWNGALLAK